MYQRDRDVSRSESATAIREAAEQLNTAATETKHGWFSLRRLVGWVMGFGGIAFLAMAATTPPNEAYPTVTIAVPEKPSRSDQIILDWPTIDQLPIRHVAFPLQDRSPTDGQGSRAPTEGSARLGLLMWLADIEGVAGLDAFSNAVQQVGLETLIQPDRRYTLLAPSNAAFAKLGPERLKALFAPGGHDELRALLSNHIIEQQLVFDDFAGKALTYKSLGHQEIDIEATDVIKVGDAAMTAADFQAANTVIHVIDDFLTPIPADDVETIEAARADNI